VPTIGETFDIDGLHVEVIDAERRRVRKVRITRASRQEDDEKEEIGNARE
jgi:CBS domain containing-hemolysin-like protein